MFAGARAAGFDRLGARLSHFARCISGRLIITAGAGFHLLSTTIGGVAAISADGGTPKG